MLSEVGQLGTVQAIDRRLGTANKAHLPDHETGVGRVVPAVSILALLVALALERVATVDYPLSMDPALLEVAVSLDAWPEPIGQPSVSHLSDLTKHDWVEERRSIAHIHQIALMPECDDQ